MTVTMQGLQLHRTKTIFFWLSLLFTAICCRNIDEKLEVVGFIEHSDFTGSNIKVNQTFSGLYVTIVGRSADGKLKTMGSSKLNEEEKFKIFLPQETVKDGVIRKDCYAKVHGASDSSCPLANSEETSVIIFQYKSQKKNTISHSAKLNLSPITCTSKSFWPFQRPKWLPILPPRFKHQTPQAPILTPETQLAPSFSPSDQPVSSLSPPLSQPDDVPPAVSPASDNPLPNTPVPVYKHSSPSPSPIYLPHKHYPPASSAPSILKPKQPSKDLSPAPAPSSDTEASPLPDGPLPSSPSPTGNAGLSPAPIPSFHNLASPPPNEALPSGLSPPPSANNNPRPPHAPRFRIPQPPPIPTITRPSPPDS
ncbi:hypothetical protein DCAR_0103931 [Daucus carota subsp. sativus]|uniref:Uncharacterized protein n=1 Tax=Daucus carota subsp. sativus TaxID=79200 RepID=A0A166IEF7_DAUCS|nr:PREDICTED: vegetative cell wall protein gp1-like [Daucus carota subsp. sativus]WOG84747.1 hypothetical protein DCAR_0103931 [Daucus carota subsp. sativus]